MAIWVSVGMADVQSPPKNPDLHHILLFDEGMLRDGRDIFLISLY